MRTKDVSLLERFAGVLRTKIHSAFDKKLLWSSHEVRLHIDSLISQAFIELLEKGEEYGPSGPTNHQARP